MHKVGRFGNISSNGRFKNIFFSFRGSLLVVFISKTSTYKKLKVFLLTFCSKKCEIITLCMQTYLISIRPRTSIH